MGCHSFRRAWICANHMYMSLPVRPPAPSIRWSGRRPTPSAAAAVVAAMAATEAVAVARVVEVGEAVAVAGAPERGARAAAAGAEVAAAEAAAEAAGAAAAWGGEMGGARASRLPPPHSPLPLPHAWQVRKGGRQRQSRDGSRAWWSSLARRCARSSGTAMRSARSGGTASAAPGAARAREEPRSSQPKSARVMSR